MRRPTPHLCCHRSFWLTKSVWHLPTRISTSTKMTDTPTPPAEATDGRLPARACYLSSHLLMRWWDKQWKTWTEWEEVSGFKLREKYGANPEEWKESCKTWIEVGGHYEYRIVTRSETVDWEISFSDKRFRDDTPTEGQCRNGKRIMKSDTTSTESVVGVAHPRLEWRCWRCGETPRRGVYKKTGERGLTCACRGYVVNKRFWRRWCALDERPWVDPNGNSAAINRNYWTMPESSRRIYVKNPLPNVHVQPRQNNH